MTASCRGVLIWSKLRQNLSEMEVRTLVRILKVIWDHLLAFKGDFIQKLYFHFCAECHALNNYHVVMLSVLFFFFCSLV